MKFYAFRCDKSCPEGVDGGICEEECPCQNEGTCNRDGTCNCPAGWTVRDVICMNVLSHFNTCYWSFDGRYGSQCENK